MVFNHLGIFLEFFTKVLKLYIEIEIKNVMYNVYSNSNTLLFYSFISYFSKLSLEVIL